MTTSHLKRPLRLTLHPQDVLPEHMSWRLHEGYVRSSTWDDDGESITLGLWGPGDVISSEDPVLHPLELHCLTTVVVEHLELDDDTQLQHIRRERQMLAELHQMSCGAPLINFQLIPLNPVVQFLDSRIIGSISLISNLVPLKYQPWTDEN